MIVERVKKRLAMGSAFEEIHDLLVYRLRRQCRLGNARAGQGRRRGLVLVFDHLHFATNPFEFGIAVTLRISSFNKSNGS